MKINLAEINEIIKRNKWIIIASIIFMIWKFFLVGLLWHDRLSPPQPDDSYIYIAHIESVKQCPTLFCENAIFTMDRFTGWSHLAYRIFFGYLALLLHVDSETMYHWSFYIGSAVLLPVLLFFLKSFTGNKKLIAFSLLFLMLPNGGGSSHSFGWVVPSFFALLLFFIILGTILRNWGKSWIWLLPLLIASLLLTHTIGVYFIIFLIFFLLVLFLFERKIDKAILKKTVFSLIFLIVLYFPISAYIASFSSSGVGNSYGPEVFLSQAIENTGSGIFPGYVQSYNNYLKWVILNPFGIILVLLLGYFSYINNQKKMIALFISSVLFLAVASIHAYGFRFLILVWPITFLFYAFGFYSAWIWIRNNFGNNKDYVRLFLKAAWLVSVLVIFAAFLTFSFLWNESANKKENISINSREYADFLKSSINKENKPFYHDSVLRTLQNIYGMRSVRQADSIDLAAYYMIINIRDEGKKHSGTEALLELAAKLVGAERQENPGNKLEAVDIGDDFSLVGSYGDIDIYQNKNLKKRK